jgi:hypothetical protein
VPKHMKRGVLDCVRAVQMPDEPAAHGVGRTMVSEL